MGKEMTQDKKILIAEADSDTLNVTVEILEKQGHTVLTCSDGLEAIDCFKAEKLDLVILAAMLPKLHGFQVCKTMKRTKGKEHIPVVITSSIYKSSLYKYQAIKEYLADDFKTKPIDADKFITTINAYMAPQRNAAKSKEQQKRKKENILQKSSDKSQEDSGIENLLEKTLASLMDFDQVDYSPQTDNAFKESKLTTNLEDTLVDLMQIKDEVLKSPEDQLKETLKEKIRHKKMEREIKEKDKTQKTTSLKVPPDEEDVIDGEKKLVEPTVKKKSSDELKKDSRSKKKKQGSSLRAKRNLLSEVNEDEIDRIIDEAIVIELEEDEGEEELLSAEISQPDETQSVMSTSIVDEQEDEEVFLLNASKRTASSDREEDDDDDFSLFRELTQESSQKTEKSHHLESENMLDEDNEFAGILDGAEDKKGGSGKRKATDAFKLRDPETADASDKEQDNGMADLFSLLEAEDSTDKGEIEEEDRDTFPDIDDMDISLDSEDSDLFSVARKEEDLIESTPPPAIEEDGDEPTFPEHDSPAISDEDLLSLVSDKLLDDESLNAEDDYSTDLPQESDSPESLTEAVHEISQDIEDHEHDTDDEEEKFMAVLNNLEDEEDEAPDPDDYDDQEDYDDEMDDEQIEDDEYGMAFGKYILIEKIATGGMAEIFKAKQRGVEGFEKLVAIKRILPHLSDNKEFVSMFIDEGKIAAQLTHQNIAQIYELGEEQHYYYIAMEFVNGRDLKALIQRSKEKHHPLSLEHAVLIISKLCSGLDYAHRKKDFENRDLNIVHRDISPQNVLISYEGEVKIIDFGIAKAAAKDHHTRAGALKGKILYMSPEQAWGRSIDKRSDIFSLGTLLYEMLTQQRLFLAPSEIQILQKVREAKVDPPSKLRPDIPEQLCIIIQKALAKDPDQRYSSAGEMQRDLDTFLYSRDLKRSSLDIASYMHLLFEEEIEGELPDASDRMSEIEAISIFQKDDRHPPPEMEEDTVSTRAEKVGIKDNEGEDEWETTEIKKLLENAKQGNSLSKIITHPFFIVAIILIIVFIVVIVFWLPAGQAAQIVESEDLTVILDTIDFSGLTT